MSEPSETAVKTLYALSGNTCFYQGCDLALTDPKWKRVRGRVAHIKGERPGSARYDPDQPDWERQGFDNLMLLCPNHHALIDEQEPDDHPVERLTEMKERHLRHSANSNWCPTDEQQTAFARDAIAFAVEASGDIGALPP